MFKPQNKLVKVVSIIIAVLALPFAFLVFGAVSMGDCEYGNCPDTYNLISVSGTVITSFIVYYSSVVILNWFIGLFNFFDD
tara:strand:+ start:101 stop:343 length:243 start_codon:yes stop_codon:yes gene_type:complete